MAQAPPRSLGRISEIAQVAVRHGFGYFFHRNRLSDLLPGDGKPGVDAPPSERGRHLREMLDELGPTFVKFGQLLSMRPDVLPPDIIAELRGLQDDVRGFPYEEAAATIRADLALLYQAARIAKERIRAFDFIDTRALVDEFARSIRQELDYRIEARNADQFRHLFTGI